MEWKKAKKSLRKWEIDVENNEFDPIEFSSQIREEQNKKIAEISKGGKEALAEYIYKQHMDMKRNYPDMIVKNKNKKRRK